MNRVDELLERIERGAEVSPEDVTAAEAADRLATLHSTAARRSNVRQLEQTRAEQREATIRRMLQTDAEAEQHRLEIEAITREREEMLERLAADEARARMAWSENYRNFIGDFASLEPSIKALHPTPEGEQHAERLLFELRGRGALLQAVRYNIAGIGRSAIEVFSLPPIADDAASSEAA